MVQTTSVALFCLLVAPSLAVPITNDNEQYARAEDLSERDPNWFNSAVGAVRKVATPPNIAKAGRFAAGLLFREDAEEISQRDLESSESVESLVTRDDEFQLTERDVEFLKDLTARDPNWFKSAFRAVRKVATPTNLMRAGKFAAGILLREDEVEISQRDLELPESMASALIREDTEEISQRDVEYEDLSIREPKSFIEKVKAFFSPKKKAAKNTNSEEVEGREDDEDVFERYFDDYEMNDLD